MREWSHRVENTSRVVLRSFGALFFAPGSVSGLLFLVAITVISPALGLAAVTGALAATACARMLGGEKELLEGGIYGFNGVLAGLGSLSFVTPEDTLAAAPSPMGWPLIFALTAGALAGALMRLWIRLGWADRPGLPALTWPSLVSVWGLGKLACALGLLTLSADALFPPLVELRFRGYEGGLEAFRALFDEGMPYLPVAILLVAGYALETPRRLPAAVVAVLLSIAVAGMFLGADGLRLTGFTFYTAAPVAMALGWFFLTPGPRSVLVAVAAMLLSLFVWYHGGLWLEAVELPLLTLPFALTTLAVLAAVRFAPGPLRRLLPEPVPLHRVGTTESKRYGPGRSAGKAYWEAVEKLSRAGTEGVPARRIEAALAHLTTARRVVALTGAGLSTESGIPDYRSGIIDWKVYDPDELVYERFIEDENARRTYWRMSQDFYLLIRKARPSRGHLALARLEKAGKLIGIITQNVDRLHQRAGSSSEKVVEIHGHEFGVSCLSCGARYSRDEIYRWILHGTEVPYCLHCTGGLLKPDSVAFGQPMPLEASRRALDLVDRADLLLVAGTSLTVEPVASLVARAAARGARLIIINYQPTDFDAVADVLLRGSAGAILERLADDHGELRRWIAA